MDAAAASYPAKIYQGVNIDESALKCRCALLGWPLRPFDPHYDQSKKRIISEKKLQIPRDVQAVQKGARVRATDGLIGHVSEFIVDHKTGHITDLVLREGLPWDKKQVILPVVEIERIEENTVYLRLNKQAVKKRASKFKGRY